MIFGLMQKRLHTALGGKEMSSLGRVARWLPDDPMRIIPPVMNCPHFLKDIKERVRATQVKAALSVNAEMIALYWDLGRMIADRQESEGWGAKIIPRLAQDMKSELPDAWGFSERNLKRMLAFFKEYPWVLFVPRPVAQSSTTARGGGR